MVSRDKIIEEDLKNIKKKKYQRDRDTENIVDVVTNSLHLFEKYKYPEIYDIIKAKTLFSGDMRVALNKAGDHNSTAEVYPLTQSVHDSYVANLYDSLAAPRVAARNEENQQEAEEGQAFLDWAQDISSANIAEKSIVSEASLIGTSYGIGTWEERDEKIEVSVPGKKDPIVLTDKVSQPLMEHVPYFEMFYDINTKDFYKARWKARRKIMSMHNFLSKYKKMLPKEGENGYKTDEEWIEQFEDTIGDCISRYDYNKMYDIKSYEYLLGDAELDWDTMLMQSFIEDNVLTTIDESDKFIEVIEFYQDRKLTLLVNGHRIFHGKSPYPLKDPFGIVVYEKRMGSCDGIGIGQKLLPYQRQANMYWCNIKDALIQYLKPMYLQKGDITDYDGQTATSISYTAGKIWKVEGDIQPWSMINVDAIQIGINQFSETIARAHEAIGTNSYVQGGQGKIERSLGAANLKVQVAMTRLKPIIHSMSSFYQRMFEQWLTLASIKLEDEISVRVLDRYGNDGFKKFKPIDLMNKFDITVDVDALRDITRNEKAQAAMNLMNAIAAYNIDPISQTPSIAPETVIKFLSQEFDFAGLAPMTSEERVDYVTERLDIAKQIQVVTGGGEAGASTSGGQTPQVMPQGLEGITSLDQLPTYNP